jgi:hypothetical protein
MYPKLHYVKNDLSLSAIVSAGSSDRGRSPGAYRCRTKLRSTGGSLGVLLAVLLIPAVAAAPATLPATTQAADLSTPRSAARTLWLAIRAANVDRVAEMLDAPDAQSKDFTRASAQLLVAGKKLSDVASRHFGKAGQALGRTMIDLNNIDETVQKLAVTEIGDTATVTGENQTKMRFQKRNNEWRLILTEFAGASPQDVAAQINLLQQMATAMNEAASEIDMGKYQTAQEAERVIQDRLHAVMIEKFHPMSHPATRPATTRSTSQPTSRP